MNKSDFDFYLPERLIAQTPLEKRDSSRLLHLDKKTGAIEHGHFHDITKYLKKGDCLVMNDDVDTRPMFIRALSPIGTTPFFSTKCQMMVSPGL